MQVVKMLAAYVLDIGLCIAIIWVVDAVNAANPTIGALIVVSVYRGWTGDGWNKFHREHKVTGW